MSCREGKMREKRRIDLVRGVHKRIIEVKVNGSRLFDQACLVFKSGDIATKTSEKDILEEANRIIGEVGARDGKKNKVGRRVAVVILLCLLCLGAGIGIGFLLK